MLVNRACALDCTEAEHINVQLNNNFEIYYFISNRIRCQENQPCF